MNPETENNAPAWDYNCDADAGSGGWVSAAADCSVDDGAGISADVED